MNREKGCRWQVGDCELVWSGYIRLLCFFILVSSVVNALVIKGRKRLGIAGHWVRHLI